MNWKAQGQDGIHGFSFKKFTIIHDTLAFEMNRYLQQAKERPFYSKKLPTRRNHPK